jgi:hypothetical protein
MKFIIIIIFLILIVFFATKVNTEYKREQFKQGCTTACGMFTTDKGCLNCVNCGICTIKYRDRISRQCLNGDKNGAYFNNNCKGSNWNYGDKDNNDDINLAELIYQQNVRQEQIRQEVKQETKTDPVTQYDRILLSMGQQVDINKNLIAYNRAQKSSFGNFKNPDGKVDIPTFDKYAEEQNAYTTQNAQNEQSFGQNDYRQGVSRQKLNNGYDFEEVQAISKNYNDTLFTLEELTKIIK